ncbi:MAG TPA: TlpA disulfide reductase family protein [Steroidobacteraceae bacterium]|nr:TlpA disulfide reductase family protein [Steroidobacteraceae bacterium]HNS26636.1 TlpA disulfide reductase family protein [Steroidobacteraceae bacterium]
MRRRDFLAACGALIAQQMTHADDRGIALVSAGGLRSALDAERGKVVVLNLWATWCVPCLREIPDLVRIERELAPQVVLIGVAMDEPDERESRVAPFHAKYFPDFRSYLRSERELDAIASVVDPAWNEVLPTTYLLGRDGRVVRRIQGAKSHEEFRALIAAAL